MPKPTRQTSEYSEIARRYANGKASTKLAQDFNFSAKHILRIARDNGVSIRNPKACCVGRKSKPRFLTKDQEKEVCELYVSGKTEKELATIFNCSITPITNALRDSKVRTRLSLSTGKKGKYTSRYTGEVTFDDKGHRRIKVYGYPSANRGNWMYEHRYIVEQHLGRYLRQDEVVHHINHVPDDNRIENLQVMSPSEHSRLHNATK